MTYLRIPLEDVTGLLDLTGIFHIWLKALIKLAQLCGGQVRTGKLIATWDRYSETITLARKEPIERVGAVQKFLGESPLRLSLLDRIAENYKWNRRRHSHAVDHSAGEGIGGH